MEYWFCAFWKTDCICLSRFMYPMIQQVSLEIDLRNKYKWTENDKWKNASSIIIHESPNLETGQMSTNCITTVEWTNIVGIFMHWNTSAFSKANSKLNLHETKWMHLTNIMLNKEVNTKGSILYDSTYIYVQKQNLLTEQEHNRGFWNAGNGLFLDLGAYYMGVPFVVIQGVPFWFYWLFASLCIHLSIYMINFNKRFTL